MKQEIFYGSHYEIGYKFGQKQLANGIFIPDNLPFPLTQERYDFAAACLPVYRRFFPELLAEIAGLAAGQNCQTATIQAVDNLFNGIFLHYFAKTLEISFSGEYNYKLCFKTGLPQTRLAGQISRSEFL